MTKLLVNFTRKIVYLLWLRNSGYIYSGIIISVNVTGKYNKSSFKISNYFYSFKEMENKVCMVLSEWKLDNL